MNPAYQRVIAAGVEDRRSLFVTAAARIGTTVQNIEKDFWVCWTLDALYHRRATGGPRLLFKGGTSLSKAHGLISRFSEDIDVTVFREDLGQEVSLLELEKLTGKQRQRKLSAVKEACQAYVNGMLRSELDAFAKQTMQDAGGDPKLLRVASDVADPDSQSLLIHYPSAVEASEYVSPAIKIESGAKSALDPNHARTIAPYVAADMATPAEFEIQGVTTIDPARTFLDKILVLHGINCFFEAKGTLRGDGRMSRHYYDVHCMMAGATGRAACDDSDLIENCVRHARVFFFRSHTGLDDVKRGSFRLKPVRGLMEFLRADYAAMKTMIFGDVPSFDAVLESVAQAENALNARAGG